MKIRLLLLIFLIIAPTFQVESDSTVEVIEGFLNGIESKIRVDNIRSSISNNEKVAKKLEKAFNALEKKTARSTWKALKKFGHALQQIVEATKKCEEEIENGAILDGLLSALNNPKSFYYNDEFGIYLNDQEITPELTLSLNHWNSKNLVDSGYYLGKALSQAVLGEGYNKREYVDLPAFFNGILDSFDTQVKYDDIKSCISPDNSAMKGFVFDSSEFADWNQEDITRLFSTLSEKLQVLPEAIKSCSSEENFQKIADALHVFQAPTSIFYNKGKNLIINGYEIYPVFLKASFAYEDKNSYDFGSNIGLMLKMARSGIDSKIGDLKTDLEDFAYGVLEGIAAAEKWSEIKACFSTDEIIAIELDEAYRNLSRHTPENVKAGIYILGKALESIPTAIQDCKVVIEDLDGLIRAIQAFQSPVSFIYKIGRSLIINGREIYHDINSAVLAYQAQNWTGFGYYVGEALALLILKADSPLMSQDLATFINSRSNWNAKVHPFFESLSETQIKGWLVDIPTYINSARIVEYDYRGLNSKLPNQFNSMISPPQHFPSDRIVVDNAESMQYLIAYYGPVEAHMKVYEDFLYYEDGIYRQYCGKFLGIHAIRIVGWGEEEGAKYWIVENTWGSAWGQKGNAKVAFGECEIDSHAATGFALDWFD